MGVPLLRGDVEMWAQRTIPLYDLLKANPRCVVYEGVWPIR